MNFKNLHAQALAAAKKLKYAECELIELFQKIDSCAGYLELGYTSLHVYATQALGLSDDCAYKLIRVERKAVKVPELKAAIEQGQLTLSKAVVVASLITPENQEHWLQVAATSSKRDLERAVASESPEAPKPEKAKPQGNKMMRLEFSVPEESFDLFQRAQELFEQNQGRKLSFAEVLHLLSAEFVKRKDPVEKADRNAHKTGPGASALHQVHARDRARCQFQHPNGKPCGQRKWIHVHHVKPRSEGGSDAPENLLTLCAGHHRLVHAKIPAPATAHIAARSLSAPCPSGR